MKAIFRTIIEVVAVGCSVAAYAGTYYHTNADAWGTGVGFTDAKWASVGSDQNRTVADIVADDPEAMFISALGFGATLRTSGGAEVTFPGKYLQIGDSTNDGALMLKMDGGDLKTVSVSNLCLVGGAIVNGVGGTQTIKSNNAIQIDSTASRPFYFTGGKDRAITVEAGFESESTALVVVNRYSIGGNADERGNSFTLTLAGNNSGYKGKWVVDNLDKDGLTTEEQANGKPVYLSISGAEKLGANPDSLVADAITLKNNGVLLVTGDTLALGNRGLTVDSTGGRIVRNGDLTISGSISGTGTLDLTDVNGVLTLNATVADTVTIRRLIKFTNRGDNNASSDYYMNDTDKWTNGEKAKPGFGYIVDTRETENTSLRTSGHSGDNVKFNGDSLTFVGASGKVARFMHKCPQVEVATLYMNAFSRLELGGCNGTAEQKFKGDIVIGPSSAASDSAAVEFYSGDATRWLNLDGRLLGDGAIRMYGMADRPYMGFDFTDCDNSGYIGSMRAEGSGITVRFNAANGLGGSPASAMEKGFVLATDATVEFTGSDAIMVNQPNRGMFVDASGTIKTAPDVTWKGALAFSATDAVLTKTGSGTLAFEGACGAGSIAVSEGGLRFVGNTAACDVAVGANSTLGGNGTISGTVSATTGAKLEFTETEALTFTGTADLSNFSIDTTGLDTTKAYTVAKGTTSLPTLTETQRSSGWQVYTVNGNVVLNNWKDYELIVSEAITLSGYSIPSVIEEAAAWYDPSDTITLEKDGDGKITGIKNKGTVKTDTNQLVDLDLEQFESDKPAPSLSTSRFNGRQSIYFGESPNEISGFKSKGNFPADFPANGGRTLFAVAQGNVNNMIMLMISQGKENKEEGKSILLAYKSDGNYGSGYKISYSNDEGVTWTADKVPFNKIDDNTPYTDTPYVFSGRTAILSDNKRLVTSSALKGDGASDGNTNEFNMPAGQSGTRFNVYYGAFEVDLGWWHIKNDTNGYQGEALIFTNALNDTQMAQVNEYLRAKWLDAGRPAALPKVSTIVANAQVDLGGVIREFTNISGSGSFVNGTVVLNGDLEITVNANGTVVAPSFDKLVLGPSARIVVNGAQYLPASETVRILSFASLDGTFSSVVSDNGASVLLRYDSDRVSARRDSGMLFIVY